MPAAPWSASLACPTSAHVAASAAMRPTLSLLLLALGLLVLPSCVIVPRYAREHVTDPAMDPSSDALGSRELRKLHWAREGAAGGDGAPAGGGCACGT